MAFPYAAKPRLVRAGGIRMNKNHHTPTIPQGGAGYAELCATSNFTFLTGASHPEELITRAAALGLSAIAITDRNSLAGVVRAYSALKTLRQEAGQAPRALPKLITGCRLVLRDSPVDWIALPRDRAAYQRLTRLLTLGKRRAGKGECHLDRQDMLKGCKGMILIALPHKGSGTKQVSADIQAALHHYPGHVFLGAAPRYDGSDQAYLKRCAALALKTAAPMVAVGDVLMHHGSRHQLADVLTCMREHITIDQIGTRALPNAERRLKGAADMARLFRNHPAAIRRTLEIAARCSFCLSELSYEYPNEISDVEEPQARLERLTREGLERRCPDGVPERYGTLAAKELKLVEELGFAAYFLTVHDIVQYARSLDILCQGRGSAANSILCYALGITDVSPDQITMLFERFVS